jgi:hypothetical protein
LVWRGAAAEDVRGGGPAPAAGDAPTIASAGVVIARPGGRSTAIGRGCGSGQEAFALRAEKGRSCALTRARGGLRRTLCAAATTFRKRSLVHGAGDHLGLVMRQLIGAGTPQALAARGAALLRLPDPDRGLLVLLILPPDAGPEPTSATGC